MNDNLVLVGIPSMKKDGVSKSNQDRLHLKRRSYQSELHSANEEHAGTAEGA